MAEPSAHSESSARPAGVLATLRALFVNLLGIAGTRFELLGIELAEEKERLVGLLFTAIAAAFALSLAVLLITLFCVVYFWETHRLPVIAGFAVFYIGIGVWMVSRLQAQLASHPPLFAGTIAELEKDRAALRETLKRPVPPAEKP